MISRKKPLRRGKSPKKKTSKRKLNQKCDLILRERMLERDNHECQANGEGGINCKPGATISACHVFPKGKWAVLRYVLDNVLGMCYLHHIVWQHHDPIGFTRFMERKFPERLANLERLKLTADKDFLNNCMVELLGGGAVGSGV